MEIYASTEGNVSFGNLTNKFGSCGRLGPILVRLPTCVWIIYQHVCTNCIDIVILELIFISLWLIVSNTMYTSKYNIYVLY